MTKIELTKEQAQALADKINNLEKQNKELLATKGNNDEEVKLKKDLLSFITKQEETLTTQETELNALTDNEGKVPDEKSLEQLINEKGGEK